MIVRWVVECAYVGSRGMQKTEVDDDELVECKCEEEREVLIDNAIQEDFEQKISWSRVK